MDIVAFRTSCCRSQPGGLIAFSFFYIKRDCYLKHLKLFTVGAETLNTVLETLVLYSSSAFQSLGEGEGQMFLSQRSFSSVEFCPFEKTPDKKHIVSCVWFEGRNCAFFSEHMGSLGQLESHCASEEHSL